MSTTDPKKFLSWKSQAISGVDLSRKGSIDEPIVPMVNLINEQSNYFTTSSCSGRSILFEEGTSELVQKQGCKWLYTTHGQSIADELLPCLAKSSGDAVFKFEPFVMHIQCRALQNAQELHAAAVASGFRNSGITVGKKGKIVVAIRSTHSLEVPLTSAGKLLVSHEYVAHLCKIANMKMEENLKRIERFYTNIRKIVESKHGTRDRDLPDKQHISQVIIKKKVKKDDNKEASALTSSNHDHATDYNLENSIFENIFDIG